MNPAKNHENGVGAYPSSWSLEMTIALLEDLAKHAQIPAPETVR